MHFSLDRDELEPLVELVVAATLERLAAQRQQLGDQLAFSESDAAALLGVRRHVLRDARLRGEVVGVRIGKGIRYSRDELLRFLREGGEL
jgi:hypothetical protein